MTLFSNGTEFLAWQQAWCNTCKHDINEDCEIVAHMLGGERPVEIGRGPLWSPQTVNYCTKYEPTPSRTNVNYFSPAMQPLPFNALSANQQAILETKEK